MTNEPEIGPTGEFPDGKIDPTDQGSLTLRVGIDELHNQVVIDFGRMSVRWLALGPNDAIELTEIILNKVDLLTRVANEKIRRGQDRVAAEVGSEGN
jgi:hypothetical protein